MKYEKTVEAVNGIIAEYAIPLTLRQIYYRLVVADLIPNRRAAYNSLSSQLVKAREEGLVDDNRIVDRSRRIDDFAFDSPEDFAFTKDARDLRRLKELIESKGGEIARSTLLRNSHMRVKQFDDLLATLRQSGEIDIHDQRTRGRPLPIIKLLKP